MKFIKTELPGVIIVEPELLGDERGFFFEGYHINKFREGGIKETFVQDNYSSSRKNVLRGLHYQLKHPQGKLVRVLEGEVFDVAVDIRKGSPTFKKWVGVTLDGTDRRSFYIPPGFAHGFCVLSENAIFEYKCTEIYYPEYDRGIRWNDPDINVQWPISENLILSEKDKNTPFLKDAELTDYK